MRRAVAAIGIVLSLVMDACAQTPEPDKGRSEATPAATSQTGDDALAAGLMQAMRANADRTERLAEPGEAIRAYIKAGYVRLKPEAREDYTDYRVLRLPAKLFGQELLVIEEEYQIKFIGCCVSEGVGAILRVTGDIAPLEVFASANGCSLQSGAEALEKLQKLKIKPAAGDVLSVSCRERDLTQR